MSDELLRTEPRPETPPPLGSLGHAPDPAGGAPDSPASARERLQLPVRTLGVILLLFVAFEFTLSGILQHQSQVQLTRKFQGATLTAVPEVGSPIGEMTIPKIGISRMIVVQGTEAAQTQSGPGHLVNTPLPGQPGNSVIIARRSSWGAPFADLDTLAEGDPIRIVTGQGTYDYRAISATYAPSNDDDLMTIQGEEDRLTLVTSDPPFLPQHRLVVVAELTSSPAQASAGEPLGASSVELGLASDLASLPAALGYLAAILGVLAVAKRLYRRWNPRATWLLTTPTLLALFLLFAQSLDRVLPSAL